MTTLRQFAAGRAPVGLRFNTDEEGVADLADVLERFPAAKPIKDKAVFANFFLDDWPTLAWPCGFDFSPEALYERATGKHVQWLRRVPIEVS